MIIEISALVTSGIGISKLQMIELWDFIIKMCGVQLCFVMIPSNTYPKTLESIVFIIAWTTHNMGPELTKVIFPFYNQTTPPPPPSRKRQDR